MSEPNATEQNLRSEIDRLRLLLEKALTWRDHRRIAGFVDLEPAPGGFRLVFTISGSRRDEIDVTQRIADLLNALLKGACRFTVQAYDAYKEPTGNDQLEATLTYMASTDETQLAQPEVSPSRARTT